MAFVFEYAGFDMGETNTNGVHVEAFDHKPARKVATADVPGRAGGYLGKGYEGQGVVTLSGWLIGSDWADYFAKRAAFLAALDTEDPATLTVGLDTDLITWTAAQCSGLPSLGVSDAQFAGRFAVQFTVNP